MKRDMMEKANAWLAVHMRFAAYLVAVNKT